VPKSWYDVVNSRFAGDVEAEEMANVVNMMRHIEYAVCAQKKPILVVVEVSLRRVEYLGKCARDAYCTLVGTGEEPTNRVESGNRGRDPMR
jgi:hypothetical protein